MKISLSKNTERAVSMVEFCLGVIPLVMVMAATIDGGMLYMRMGIATYVNNRVATAAADSLANHYQYYSGSGCPINQSNAQGYAMNALVFDPVAKYLPSNRQLEVSLSPSTPYQMLATTLRVPFNCIFCMFFSSQEIIASELTPIENESYVSHCVNPPSNPEPCEGYLAASVRVGAQGAEFGNQQQYESIPNSWQPCYSNAPSYT